MKRLLLDFNILEDEKVLGIYKNGDSLIFILYSMKGRLAMSF